MTTIDLKSFLKFYNYKPDLWVLENNCVWFKKSYTYFKFRPWERPIYRIWHRRTLKLKKRAEKLQKEADDYADLIKGMRAVIQQEQDSFTEKAIRRVQNTKRKTEAAISKCTLTIYDAIHAITKDW